MELRTETDGSSEEMNGGCCCDYGPGPDPVDCIPASLLGGFFG